MKWTKEDGVMKYAELCYEDVLKNFDLLRKFKDYLWSEKIDGWHIVWDGEGKLLTKTGKKEMHAPDWFLQFFPKGTPISGELVIKDKPFSQVVQLEKMTGPWQDARFYVFDTPTDYASSFQERTRSLERLVQERSGDPRCPLLYLSQTPVGDDLPAFIKVFHDIVHCRDEYAKPPDTCFGEGVVLTNPASKYPRGRDKMQVTDRVRVKLKFTKDADAVVVGYKDGKSLVVNWEGVEFNLGTGLTKHQKSNLRLNFPLKTIVTFRFRSKTSEQKPNQPVFLKTRQDLVSDTQSTISSPSLIPPLAATTPLATLATTPGTASSPPSSIPFLAPLALRATVIAAGTDDELGTSLKVLRLLRSNRFPNKAIEALVDSVSADRDTASDLDKLPTVPHVPIVGLAYEQLMVPADASADMFRTHHVGVPNAALAQTLLAQQTTLAKRTRTKTAVPVEQCAPSCFGMQPNLDTNIRCDALAIVLYGYLSGNCIRKTSGNLYKIRDKTSGAIMDAVIRRDRRGPWEEEWLPPLGLQADQCLLVLQQSMLLVFRGVLLPSSSSVPRLVPESTQYTLPIDLRRSLMCWSHQSEDSDYEVSLEGWMLRLARTIVDQQETRFIDIQNDKDLEFTACLDNGAPGDLKPYQKKIVEHCFSNFDPHPPLGGGALLFMGMGLGKTRTSLALAVKVLGTEPNSVIVVLAPKLVLEEETSIFQTEAKLLNLKLSTLRDFKNSERTTRMVPIFHSTVINSKKGSQAESALQQFIGDLDDAKQAGRRVVLIVDEAHNLRETLSVKEKKLSVFCSKIVENTYYRIFMSGSPYVNTPQDVDVPLQLASARRVDFSQTWTCNPLKRRDYIKELNVSIAWMMTRVATFPLQINHRHGVPMHEFAFQQLREFYEKKETREVLRRNAEAQHNRNKSGNVGAKSLHTYVSKLLETLDDKARIKNSDAIDEYMTNVRNASGDQETRLKRILLNRLEIDWDEDSFFMDARWGNQNPFLVHTRKFALKYKGDEDEDISFYNKAEGVDVDTPLKPTWKLMVKDVAQLCERGTRRKESQTTTRDDMPRCFLKALSLLETAIREGSLPMVFNCYFVGIGVSRFYSELLQFKDAAVSPFTYAMITGDDIRIGHQRLKSDKAVLQAFKRGLVDVLIYSNKVSEGVNIKVEHKFSAEPWGDKLWEVRQDARGTFVRRKLRGNDYTNLKGTAYVQHTHWRKVQCLDQSLLRLKRTGEYVPIRFTAGEDRAPIFVQMSTDMGQKVYICDSLPPVRQFCHLNTEWNFARMRQAQGRVIRVDSHPTIVDQHGKQAHPFARGKVHVHTIVTERADANEPLCQTADEYMERAAYEKLEEMDMRAEQLAMSEPEQSCSDTFVEKLAEVTYKGAALAAPRNQRIALDAPPMTARPEQLLQSALHGTSLPVKEASTRLFGEWTFDYADVPPDEWAAALPFLETNIRRLYHDGRIRYGSWS